MANKCPNIIQTLISGDKGTFSKHTYVLAKFELTQAHLANVTRLKLGLNPQSLRKQEGMTQYPWDFGLKVF